MESALIPPAEYLLAVVLAFLIPVAGVGIFTYIIGKRLAPIIRSAPDFRLNRYAERVAAVAKLWLAQWKQPRYMKAGVIHILIFAGFIVLSIRSVSLVCIGMSADFVFPGFGGTLGHIYNFIKDYAATWVLVACILGIYRRTVTKPERYKVPEKYGREHTGEAVFVLCLISLLMISESLFAATAAAANMQQGLPAEYIAPLSLPWFFRVVFSGASASALQFLHILAYFVHDLTFFFFLCFLPLGKHFHVITSIFNVFFKKLDKGTIKPVKWGVEEEQLDELESFGVKEIDDFTWKHILDFYSCADCGRCSDQCPANAVKRPLSPRFITIRGRDQTYKTYPLRDDFKPSEPLVGNIYEEDEIWSCTTCGACEEECPICIEYIDKIVDLRRGMVDEGMVPQSLQKPLSALEKRGNPYGKTEKKRADWIKALKKDEGIGVKILGKKESAETLYFVDSITSYDDRIQDIGKATAKVLNAAGIDFGVLGPAEKDSGHEVRRFGEEMLFMDLKDKNTNAILASGVKNITTADPHAYNALKKDYAGLPPVEHISETILKAIGNGRIRLKEIEGNGAVYTYHDPCYLGRHNGLYDIPRRVVDAIPGIKRIDMEKSRDRSFCCGGGGLMLFYEPIEEQRMGQLRVQMAHEAGATVIVTACPFCMVNIEDAIKTSGLEGEMRAIDLVELVSQHME